MSREDGATALGEMPVKFTQELKDKWTTALRSGEFEQHNGQLYSPNGGFCCLGVLAKVAGWKIDSGINANIGGESLGYKPFETMFGNDIVCKLYSMNDDDFHLGKNKKFPEIADFIDANIEAVV